MKKTWPLWRFCPHLTSSCYASKSECLIFNRTTLYTSGIFLNMQERLCSTNSYANVLKWSKDLGLNLPPFSSNFSVIFIIYKWKKIIKTHLLAVRDWSSVRWVAPLWCFGWADSCRCRTICWIDWRLLGPCPSRSGFVVVRAQVRVRWRHLLRPGSARWQCPPSYTRSSTASVLALQAGIGKILYNVGRSGIRMVSLTVSNNPNTLLI